MKFGAREQFIITLAAMALLLLVVGYFLPYKIFSAIQHSSAAIEAARERISFLELATEQAGANDRRLKENAELIGRINSAYLDEKNPLSFIETIERVAKTANVDLSIDLLEGSQEEAPLFRLVVIGKSTQALEFLRLLENAPVFVEVREFSLRKLSAEEISAHLAKKKVAPPDTQMVIFIRGLAE